MVYSSITVINFKQGEVIAVDIKRAGMDGFLVLPPRIFDNLSSPSQGSGDPSDTLAGWLDFTQRNTMSTVNNERFVGHLDDHGDHPVIQPLAREKLL
jgi:hypothetical protein